MLNLEPIKERRAKATEGPYGYTTDGDGDEFHYAEWPYQLISKTKTFERWPSYRPGEQHKIILASLAEAEGVSLEEGFANADFLAASWQDIGDLIDEVERLRKENSQLGARLNALLER